MLPHRRPHLVNGLLPLINLLLGLTFFIGIALSNGGSAVTKVPVSFAIIDDWLHLLAAALWIGGLMYIAIVYLPVLAKQGLADAARSLVTVLPYFAILAISGVVIMSATSTFRAIIHLYSWNQLFQTAYGRVLLIKIALVGGLLITSAVHVGLWHPRLKKAYRKYSYALVRLADMKAVVVVEAREAHSTSRSGMQDTSTSEREQPVQRLIQQVDVREKRLEREIRRQTTTLRWESNLGVAILVCVGLMNVFAGTLSPIAATSQQPAAITQIYAASLRTTDGKFNVTLTVNPNRFGKNEFIVSVTEQSTNQPDTNVRVTIYTTMLDMAMGTQSLNLLPDGKGRFSMRGNLSMAGDWQIRIQIRTPENTLHDAIADLTTPM
jgi:copper transport protein